ncbi:HNH endonuclease signature motif containing protein [Pararcticibacter amylolyticus]|nr:HNH endonuclease signature motif containing protein [Pararcticibacter amylolyticus]
MRKPNTDQTGRNFSPEIIAIVWKKATIVSDYDPNKIRKDTCGAWIQFDKHGETMDEGLGWEIDHIMPVAKGGDDLISNLQPLQWQNNRAKGDKFPASNYCVTKVRFSYSGSIAGG